MKKRYLLIALLIIGILIIGIIYVYNYNYTKNNSDLNYSGSIGSLKGNVNSLNQVVGISNYSIIDSNDTDNSETVQYYPNMRFFNRNITYRIDSGCSGLLKQKMEEAFQIISNNTKIINFTSVSVDEDIYITCNDSYNLSEMFIKTGEGGAYSIFSTGEFYIINKGRIEISNDSFVCDQPITELHELLHVFGFKHSQNSQSIMYAYLDCNQRLTLDILDKLKSLYSYDNLPDLYFDNLSVLNDSEYLNFSARILNKGLKDAKNVSLDLFNGDKKINSFVLGDIDYGEGKIINVDNIYIGDLVDNKYFMFRISNVNDLNLPDNTKIVRL